MSETWSGPGWWMASDGLWYPPRAAREVADVVDDGVDPNDRWSRRAAGEGMEEVEGLLASDRRIVEAARGDRPGLSENGAGEGRKAGALPSDTNDPEPEPLEPVRVGRKSADGPADDSVETEGSDGTQATPVEAAEEADDSEFLDLRETVELREPHADRGVTGPITTTVGAVPLAESVARRMAESRATQVPAASGALGEPPWSEVSTASAGPEATGTREKGRPTKSSRWPKVSRGSASVTPADPPAETAPQTDSSSVAEADPSTYEVLEPPRIPSEPASIGRPTARSVVLLAVATLLAVTCGILGALWLRERSTTADLRIELTTRQEVDPTDDNRIVELENQLATLQLQNDELDRTIEELRTIVPDVPPGRVAVIEIPLEFEAAFVGESGGRFIAISSTGQYVIWADGIDSEITDSGTLDGEPLGLAASGQVSWVPTSAGEIQLLAMDGTEDPEPFLTGEVDLLTRSSRSLWGYSPDAGELRQYRQTNGRAVTRVELPAVPRKITAGAGAVWVLADDGLVYRINTADFTLSPLSAGAEVVSIAAGADALWSLSAADGSLRRLDAVSGEVLVTVPVGRDPIAAVVSGNSVWVALRSGSKLIEVDTRTSAVVSRTDLPGVPTKLTRGDAGVLVTLDGDTPLVRVASIVPDVADAETDGADDAAAG